MTLFLSKQVAVGTGEFAVGSGQLTVSGQLVG